MGVVGRCHYSCWLYHFRSFFHRHLIRETVRYAELRVAEVEHLLAISIAVVVARGITRTFDLCCMLQVNGTAMYHCLDFVQFFLSHKGSGLNVYAVSETGIRVPRRLRLSLYLHRLHMINLQAMLNDLI